MEGEKKTGDITENHHEQYIRWFSEFQMMMFLLLEEKELV
jgi:hypothetical protein